MGMTKEIEQVFQHVIENDLARISRSAAASYHSSFHPPSSVFQFSRPTTGNSVRIQGQDYQIVKIELDPLEAHAESRMQKIKSRRAFRNVNTSFETLVGCDKSDEAYHQYYKESGAEGPISIVPRFFEETTVNDELPYIIAVAGVDYVRKDIVYSQQLYESLDIINIVNKTPLASIDQWPEEVVLRHPADPDNMPPVTYIRFDVEYWVDGEQQNHRFGP